MIAYHSNTTLLIDYLGLISRRVNPNPRFYTFLIDYVGSRRGDGGDGELLSAWTLIYESLRVKVRGGWQSSLFLEFSEV